MQASGPILQGAGFSCWPLDRCMGAEMDKISSTADLPAPGVAAEALRQRAIANNITNLPTLTIDKYTLLNKELAAITWRDPTIVARIWPVAENYTAMAMVDHLIAHYGYLKIKSKSI